MVSEKAKVLIRKYGESVVNGRTPTYEEMCNENTRKWELIFHISTLESKLADAQARLAGYEWIPVSERMPDDWESVLTIDISKSTRGPVTAFYNPETSLWSAHFGDLWVTHWMPLPEPPIVYGKERER